MKLYFFRMYPWVTTNPYPCKYDVKIWYWPKTWTKIPKSQIFWSSYPNCCIFKRSKGRDRLLAAPKTGSWDIFEVSTCLLILDRFQSSTAKAVLKFPRKNQNAGKLINVYPLPAWQSIALFYLCFYVSKSSMTFCNPQSQNFI